MVDTEYYTDILTHYKMYKEKELEQLSTLFAMGETLFAMQDERAFLIRNLDMPEDIISYALSFFKKYKTMANMRKEYTNNRGEVLSYLSSHRITIDEIEFYLQRFLHHDYQDFDILSKVSAKLNAVVPAQFTYIDRYALEYSHCVACGSTEHLPLKIITHNNMSVPLCPDCDANKIDYKLVSSLYYNLLTHYIKMADAIRY